MVATLIGLSSQTDERWSRTELGAAAVAAQCRSLEVLATHHAEINVWSFSEAGVARSNRVRVTSTS